MFVCTASRYKIKFAISTFSECFFLKFSFEYLCLTGAKCVHSVKMRFTVNAAYCVYWLIFFHLRKYGKVRYVLAMRSHECVTSSFRILLELLFSHGVRYTFSLMPDKVYQIRKGILP